MTAPMEQFGPYDSGAGGDVTESMWRDMMYHLRDDGVIATKSYPPEDPSEMEVYADETGMQVKVKAGEVWIRGHWGEITTTKTLPITAAHATLDRIDYVIARADFVDNVVELDVITGTAAASPVAPTLTQSSLVWEIPLATVAVNSTVVTIADADVTDQRRRVGTGLFNHETPNLYYEGTFNSQTKNLVRLGGADQERWCRWFLTGKILHVRYDFRWGTDGTTPNDWFGGTGRIFTELPGGLECADLGPTRIPCHLWTHTPTDRDWAGTAIIAPAWGNSYVWPFFPRSETDCRIRWYVINTDGGTTKTPSFTDTNPYPEGGSLVIQGHLEVK